MPLRSPLYFSCVSVDEQILAVHHVQHRIGLVWIFIVSGGQHNLVDLVLDVGTVLESEGL